ncbi:WbqC family protein [Prochlorococcus sp. AH-716-D13]|nr:WbqC family protein [Prochlorococcus sp. AH-716-D13]
MSRIAIMQPTYLPWLGYFGLMHYVDKFVFLDSVQFEKRSWQQRNKIKITDGERYLTIPVESKGKRDQLIREVKVVKSSNFENQHKRLIKQYYSNSPYFEENYKTIFNDQAYNSHLLSEITINLILNLKELLGLKVQIYKSSEIETKGAKDVLLASICNKLEADEYISPPGSKNYLLASNEFSKNCININYFEYVHPSYKQLYKDFVPYLSIIDLIFNCGPNSLEIVKKGIKF